MVVDDHPAVRSGLKALVATDPRLEPVAAVADADAAMTAFELLRPDVVIVDYRLGSANGLSLCLALKACPRPPRVLIFSAFADRYLAAAAIIAGADGILAKTALGDEVCASIRALARGEKVTPHVSAETRELVASSLDFGDVAILRRGTRTYAPPPLEPLR